MEKKIKLPLRQYGSLLAAYLKPQRSRVTVLALLILSSLGLQLINPQIVRVFLDTAEAGSGINKLYGAAALFMGFAIVRQIIQIVATYVGEQVAWTATNALRADLALHCLRLDMSFHKKYKPGELIERVDGDVNQLADFFSQLVVQLGGNFLLVIGALLMLWLQDWRIGLSVAIAAFSGVAALNWLRQFTVPRWQALREVDAKLFGFLEEWLNGIEEIRTSGAEPYIMVRLYQTLRDRWHKILSAMRVQVLVADLPLGVFALAYSMAHIIGNSLFQEGGMSIGTLYLIFYYLDVMREPLWQLRRQIENLQRASASINRITEMNQVKPSVLDQSNGRLPAGPLTVSFENVSFRYEDDLETDVLQGINLRLKPGSTLGLLGRTGSGKSTLTKLLFRFHDPSQGSITLGDEGGRQQDLRQVALSELRKRVGMVTQQVQLFNATVRQNVTMFDDGFADDRLLQVIEEVGLRGWLDELPKGLDTVLDAGGGSLSSGQAQLLAFARVFLADPGLVILDEASSRLDPATEQLVEMAVDRLLENRTGIIVAHRLGSVKRVDEIMILQDGQVAEHGARAALAADPESRFAGLLRAGLEEALA